MPVDFKVIVGYNMTRLGYASVKQNSRDSRVSATADSATLVLPIRTI
jgi:hypothetical protein